MNYHKSKSLAKGDGRKDLIRYINMKLASMGQPIFKDGEISNNNRLSDQDFVSLSEGILLNYRERMRLLSGTIINPIDRRIQDFINKYLGDIENAKDITLPFDTFVLDRPGIGREVSLPADSDELKTEYIESYRIKQGVLHNPRFDRRTTKGTFHIVSGGLPIPDDKIEVPKGVFANILRKALNPPKELLELPFTSNQEEKVHVMASLLLRPAVSPEIKGVQSEKSMEVRFFAPGSLVSNLDFVESIFGNGGDPSLFQNDAGLDIEHWTGHTGCVIIAPHLSQFTKKELGLPNYEDASERRRRDGMCWKDESEKYNNGTPFKLTCRDESGIVITLIADNYFGYSKKEVKTQIGYSANLFGNVEEEHAGGTLAFSRKNYGQYFYVERFMKDKGFSATFEDIKNTYGDIMNIYPQNYGVDKMHSNIFYIPENSNFQLYESTIVWLFEGKEQSIKLLPDHYYVIPSGHKVHMEKHPFAPNWRLVLTTSDGTLLHKPATVSGGGKSEISKSLLNAIIYGNFYVDDYKKDFDKVDEVLNHNFSNRWKSKTGKDNKDNLSILDTERLLGSVVKLLTPYNGYTDEYNKFLRSIPENVKAIILLVKGFAQLYPDKNWRDLLSVDQVNGRAGHVLIHKDHKLISSYLRVGFTKDNSWYVHSLRPDFIASAKIQIEDDITVSTVLPAKNIKGLDSNYKNPSVKFVQNCEYLFFQRPDEAINRGYDKQAEEDLSGDNLFASNYEPLSKLDAKDMIEDAIRFDQYTDPIKNLITKGAKDNDSNYLLIPSHTRVLKDGSRTKNPRYLQVSPSFSNPLDSYLAEVGARFNRNVALKDHVLFPVNDVLPGRRNNPPDKKLGIRPLCVHNPIHYQELPELFMDFISSLTGKSPSTTGAGSEGALTKGPFNMLMPTADLNNALVSFILTGYNGFSSAAGYIGPKYRVDHDISMLVPELWCRMSPEEKDPKNLIKNGNLTKLEDFDYKGQKVLASRLGYRIAEPFAFHFLGKIFEEPLRVFTKEMLEPELQDMESFVDGINNIVESQQKTAKQYFDDGSINTAIPPLKALLHIMAYGEYQGKKIEDKEIRNLFDYDYVISSEWYSERLKKKQSRDIQLWKKHISYLSNFIKETINQSVSDDLKLKDRLDFAQQELKKVKSKDYLESLKGTIGADLIDKY